MVAIPDNDVADAHGNANSAGALDLRAAYLDGVAVADIFLNRSGQPRRGHFEIDRTCTEPPPQNAEASGEDHRHRRDRDRQPLDPAFTREPSAHRLEIIAEPMQAGVRSGQQPARAVSSCLVVVLIPTGVIQLRGLDVSTWMRLLGRSIPCHCLSVPALIVRWIAAQIAPLDA